MLAAYNNRLIYLSSLRLLFQICIIRKAAGMINPHHNININISYNMPGDKADKHNKSTAGKRIAKTSKNIYTLPADTNDIDIKPHRKNLQNNLKKANEHKPTSENKKQSKKKTSTIHRNTITPDLFMDRRFKTEGPTTEPDQGSTFKKESKSRQHYRSTQPVINKTQGSKKSALNKSTKTVKEGHVNSCSLEGWKKMPIGLSQHVVSQSISGIGKKKRAHSTFTKNDKVVSRLLNISLLASQLGGSRPITSERRNEQPPSKTFKEEMSSIDMRIIRSMQNDVPIFRQKQTHPDVIRSILRSKGISLQILTRKVIFIQKLWRKKQRNSVINKYRFLFQQATNKLSKQFGEVSDIAPEQQLSVSRDFDLFTNQNLASTLNRRSNINSLQPSERSSEQRAEEDNYIHRWIEEEHDNMEGSAHLGLNMKVYRDLVDKEKNQIGKKNLNRRQELQRQQNWGIFNKNLASIINDKHKGKQKVSSLVYEQLYKQSQINKDLFEKDIGQPSMAKKQQRVEFNHSSSNEHYVSSEDFHPQTSMASEKQFDDSFDQSQQYDCNKYENANFQEAIINAKKEKQSISVAKIEEIKPDVREKRQEEDSKIKQIEIRSLEKQWMNSQLMRKSDRTVNSYLNCELDGFGLMPNQRDFADIQPQQNQQEEDNHSDNDNALYSSDQAIGSRFQRANLNILRRNRQHEADQEPKRKINAPQADKMVDQVIDFLICEFASDISTILKKCTVSPPPKKSQAPNRLPGIPTDFLSIQTYISKLQDHISKDDKLLKKILENINKDIGPTSLEILSYLRPEPEDGHVPMMPQNEQPQYDDQEGLFVIPAELFQQFEVQLQAEFKQIHNKQMGPRAKTFMNFWHRCIFESYNQCLDYQRPFGIQGKPYQWVTETKIMRIIRQPKIINHMKRAENRLLELSQMVGGLIFEKPDCPFANSDLSQEQMHMMNQERLSRILATELLESEQAWVNYNDQMAELQVELSRLIEERLFGEVTSQLKKLQRRRKVIAEESAMEDPVVFNIEEL